MEYLSSGAWPALRATLWLIFFLTAAASAGAWVLIRAGLPRQGNASAAPHGAGLSRGETLLYALSLGLVMFALAVYGIGSTLGLAAWTPVVITLVFFIPLLSARARAAVLSPPICANDSPESGRAKDMPWLRLAMAGLTAAGSLALALSWLQATLPPTAADALSYHLSHPKAFLASGHIGPILYARESLWPYLIEMLFTAALPTGGTILATLFHWIFYVLTGTALYLLGSRFTDRVTGALAAVIFWMTPAAFAQSGQPYVDLAAAFFLTMTLYAYLLLDLAVERGTARSADHTPGHSAGGKRTGEDAVFHAALLGVWIGALLSVKYLSLGAALLWTPIVLWRTRKVPAAAATYLAAMLLVGAVWYVRSWIVLGNPVYPFLPEWFGGRGVDSGIGLEGIGSSWVHLVLLPWNMTFRPASFGGDIIGPFALWGLPGLILWGRCLKGAWRIAAAAGLLYAAFLFTQSQNTRFFLSLLPWCSLGAAYVLVHLARGSRMLRNVIALALCIVFAAHAGIFLYRTRAAWPMLTGRVSAEEHRSRYDRSYPAHQYLLKHLRPGEKVYNAADAKFFYWDRPGVMTMHNTILRQAQTGPGGFWGYLESSRFDYLWLETGFNAEFERWALEHGYAAVYEYRFTESPKTYEYRIYKLQ